MGTMNIFDLSGKTALVTGAGSGIGRAYSEAMAEFGASVACADISEDGAKATVALVEKLGGKGLAIRADASKAEDIEGMVSRTINTLGSIDIVFANAAIGDQYMVKIHEKPVEDWDAVMALQPRGVFLLMKAIFPIMIKKKAGSFIATASIGGLTVSSAGGPFELIAAYDSAKAATIMLTKVAAKQYGEYGIRVNSICPGYQRTAMIPEDQRSMMEKLILKVTPLQRVGLPQEMKGLAVWLASDASAFVTGQTFVQDGGMIA